jgi:hypothetical protein
MKKIISTLLGLTAIGGFAISPQLPPAIAMPATKNTDFTRQPPMGMLGQPLGRIMTISGVVRQAALGAKGRENDLVLSIEAVNDRPLAKPITMLFQIFTTAKITKPVLGQTFRYVGYETGGFTGVPAEAFKWVPVVTTTNYHFEAFYQILHEDLEQVKAKADLLRSNDRRVQIVGKYVSSPKQPPTAENANVVNPITGKPILQASYTTVNIELADGTLVPLFSPLNKLSNRPAQEVHSFDGKLVRIVGLLAKQPISTSIQPKYSIAIVRMDRIELDRGR